MCVFMSVWNGRYRVMYGTCEKDQEWSTHSSCTWSPWALDHTCWRSVHVEKTSSRTRLKTHKHPSTSTHSQKHPNTHTYHFDDVNGNGVEHIFDHHSQHHLVLINETIHLHSVVNTFTVCCFQRWSSTLKTLLQLIRKLPSNVLTQNAFEQN